MQLASALPAADASCPPIIPDQSEGLPVQPSGRSGA